MATFAGLRDANVEPLLLDNSGGGKAYERDAPSGLHLSDTLGESVMGEMYNLVAGSGKTDHVVGNTHIGIFTEAYPEWFENFHVVPRSFDFGNVLSAQTSPLTVFSGYRLTEQTWSSFVNNAGAGTELTGMPGLPETLFPLAGFTGQLEVSTSGNPTVDDDLAFIFNFGGAEINVPIVLSRIVLFPVRPEIPYVEKLGFLTDIIKTADGSEQRIALRKNPRQMFEWDVRLDDGEWEKARMDALLFDWQGRTWGIPIWHEATTLTVAATAGDLTINVGSTADADYRVGGLVMIYTDAQTFDVQTVASLTSTTITIDNAILNSYAVGASVTPLRAGFMKRSVKGSRWRTADQNLRVQFTVTDNDSNIGSVSGLDTYNSKVLVDNCNTLVGATINETYLRDIVVIDNQTGMISQDSPWDNGKHSTGLTIRVNNKADLWTWRKFLHAMRGRQISFYVPTYNKDLLPTADLETASQDLIIQNIGYTQFVHERQPKTHIWLRKTDGTILTRGISNSTETSSSIETLVVNSTWGEDIAVADIDRISYLEEVRFNTDDITIRHERGDRIVRISAPIISTFD